MKKKPMAGLAIGLCMFGIGGSANATVLTFDDYFISGGIDGAIITRTYGGLHWENMGYLNATIRDRRETGFFNAIVSGEWVAFNGFGEEASVYADNGTFDFNGAYLTAARSDGLQVEVTGLLGATELYQRTVAVSYDFPTWFDFNFTGIDTLRFRSFGGTAHDGGPYNSQIFAMDNFTFNETAPVPEPATMLLFGSGLAGLVGSRVRKWKKDK